MTIKWYHWLTAGIGSALAHLSAFALFYQQPDPVPQVESTELKLEIASAHSSVSALTPLVADTLAPKVTPTTPSVQPADVSSALRPLEVIPLEPKSVDIRATDTPAVVSHRQPDTADESLNPVVPIAQSPEQIIPLPTSRPEYTFTPPPRQRQTRSRRSVTTPPSRSASRATAPPRQQTTRSQRTQRNTTKRRASQSSRNTASAAGATRRQQRGATFSRADKAAVSRYPARIQRKVRNAHRYPPAAKARRLQGTARVTFTVRANGGVSGIRLSRSAGHTILDKAALATVRRAAPFPAIPHAAGRKSWTFTVPVRFGR